MPLPTPFYLRTTQTTALTHAELDGNFTILNTKIDNTTTTNVGVGLGIFKNKDVGANDGTSNLYSLSGTNGVTIGLSGDTIIIRGNIGDSGVYWTSGSTGNFSIKTINDTNVDATDDYSVAQGNNTIASGLTSHSEGVSTVAGGYGSHSEGRDTYAFGDFSHSEGTGTFALGSGSHSQNVGNTASAAYSHAGGFGVTAGGSVSFAHYHSVSSDAILGKYSAALGGAGHNISTQASSSFIGGGQYNGVIDNENSTLIGGIYNTTRNGEGCAVIGGSGNTSIHFHSTVMGVGNEVSGDTSLVFGGARKADGYVGNLVYGKMNFVGGSENTIDSDFNSVLGSINTSRANNISIIGTDNLINSGGVKNEDFLHSFVSGLKNQVINKVSTVTIFGQDNRVGGRVLLDGSYESPSGGIFVGLENIVTGTTRQTSILAGEGNVIGTGEPGIANGVSNSAILAGNKHCLGVIPGITIKNSSILSGVGMTGFTNQTSYTEKLQATKKVRVSSYNYITTNNLTQTDTPTIHNVVHDVTEIEAIPGIDGGGEIVRYGLCASTEFTYSAGRIVYLAPDGCWKAANVATSGVTDGRMLGFALSESSTGETGTGKGIVIRGHIRLPSLPSGAQPGDPLYLDASTPGTLTKNPPTSSGNIVRAVGHLVGGGGLTSSGGYMFFNPDITFLQVS